MLLHYTDDGPGPAVVLLHGFPLDHSNWEPQRHTIGLVYRLILPDLRGHGRSAAPEGVYTMDDLADDVIELLDALGLTEPLVLGGLSMGGYVAQSIALRYPERLRGLILVNTRAAADTPEAARNRQELAREVEATESVDRVVETMVPKLFAPRTVREHPGLVERVRSVMANTTDRAVVGSLRGMAARPDRTADLPSIRVPTLVIAGAEDAIVPPDEARRMAESLPSGRLVMIPDAGHLAPLENPEATDAALTEFLDPLH